jgi:hypothetical protein
VPAGIPSSLFPAFLVCRFPVFQCAFFLYTDFSGFGLFFHVPFYVPYFLVSHWPSLSTIRPPFYYIVDLLPLLFPSFNVYHQIISSLVVLYSYCFFLPIPNFDTYFPEPIGGDRPGRQWILME